MHTYNFIGKFNLQSVNLIVRFFWIYIESFFLASGGTYKFRIAAVYSNNDNKVGPNSKRFYLEVLPHPEPRPPKVKPKIVEAKPLIYQNIYAIGLKWQVRNLIELVYQEQIINVLLFKYIYSKKYKYVYFCSALVI